MRTYEATDTIVNAANCGKQCGDLLNASCELEYSAGQTAFIGGGDMACYTRSGVCRRVMLCALLVLCAFTAGGCSTLGYTSNEGEEADFPEIKMTPTNVGVTSGALLGAGLGAIIGSTTGSAGGGLAIGTAAGAAAGGAIGYGFEEQKKDGEVQKTALLEQSETIAQQQREINELRAMMDDQFSRNNRPSRSGRESGLKSSKVSASKKGIAEDDIVVKAPSVAARNTASVAKKKTAVKEVPVKEVPVKESVVVAKNVSKKELPSRGSAAVDTASEEEVAKSQDFPPARTAPVVDTPSNEISRVVKKDTEKEASSLTAKSAVAASDENAKRARLANEEEVKVTAKKAQADSTKIGVDESVPEMANAAGADESSKTKATNNVSNNINNSVNNSVVARTAPAADDASCIKAEDEAKKAGSSKSAADKLFYFRRALRYCPGEARYHYEIGRVYSTIGRKDDAAYELRQALDLDPGLSNAKSELDKLGG